MEDGVFADLNALDVMTPSDEGYWLELVNPVTKKPIFLPDGQVAGIKLAGPRSERMQKFITEALDKVIRDQRKGNLANDAESQRARETEIYVHATLEWRLPKLDGKELTLSLRAARQLYSDLRFSWLREQVAAGVNDETPFLKKLQETWNGSPSAPSS